VKPSERNHLYLKNETNTHIYNDQRERIKTTKDDDDDDDITSRHIIQGRIKEKEKKEDVKGDTCNNHV
jgi:hypothetical protein